MPTVPSHTGDSFTPRPRADSSSRISSSDSSQLVGVPSQRPNLQAPPPAPSFTDLHCSWTRGTPTPASCIHTARWDVSCLWACLTAAQGIRCPPLDLLLPTLGIWNLPVRGGGDGGFVASWAGSWAAGKERAGIVCSASLENREGCPLSWAACSARQDDWVPGGVCCGWEVLRRGDWGAGGAENRNE